MMLSYLAVTLQLYCTFTQLSCQVVHVSKPVYTIDPMIGENRQLVTDEPVEFEK